MPERGGARPRIVLTGATGFIGRHLQVALAAAGYELVLVVRPGSRNRHHAIAGAEVREAALDDSSALAAAFGGATFGVYCAGAVRGCGYDDFAAANVAGVAHFAAAAAATLSHPRVVLISSLAASRPDLSHYAASKRAGEDALHDAGVASVVLRPPAVYGPGDREMRPLFAAMRRGLAVRVGPREQRLSLLNVADLAAAVVAVLAHFETCSGAVYELDDGHVEGYGWPDVIACARAPAGACTVPVPRAVLTLLAMLNLRLAHLFGYAPMLTPGKVRELSEARWLCNNHALTAATGWSPHIGLRDGIRAMFERPSPGALA